MAGGAAAVVKIALRRPVATLLVGLLALGVSVLPTVYFNQKMSGDWLGSKLTNATVQHALIYRTGANVALLASQNLVPPIFPIADHWNEWVKSHMPGKLAGKLDALLENPACWFPVAQMQAEESAGLGLGVFGLLAASWLAVGISQRNFFAPEHFSWVGAVRWSSVLAFLALLTQSNLYSLGRLSAAYYLLPFPIILMVAGQEALVRRPWWRWLAWLVFGIAAVLLILSPARPLFPRDQLLKAIIPRETAHQAFLRLDKVYSVYRDRSDCFAAVLAELPSDTKVLGYVAYHEPEACLWRPIGARQIIPVCPDDQVSDLKAQGIRYILISPSDLQEFFDRPASLWLQQMNATIVRKFTLRLRASVPPQDFWLVQLP